MSEALDRALDARSSVAITGGPGSGKSAAAVAVAVAAEQRGLHPILVRPPLGAADAGVLALAGAARRLGGSDAVRGGWDATRRRAARLLHDHRDRVVVVCDDPSRWGTAGGLFNRRAAEACDVLFGIDSGWASVVCDQRAHAAEIRLPTLQQGFALDEHWGELDESAQALMSSPLAQQLRTPLAFGLACALLAWDRDPQTSDAGLLAAALAEALASRRHGKALWALWQRLALARTDLDSSTLAQLGADRLSPLGLDTLRLALLDGAGRLHDVVRTAPEIRPPDPELADQQRREAHEFLFEYHRDRFEALVVDDPAAAGDHAAEALYHAGELNDEQRADVIQVDLVEQLNALGHRIGAVHQNYPVAAAVFNRALETDADDAFALQHHAFYLDAQGIEASAVQHGYARSLDLDPGQPSWHARYVSFLAHMARLKPARQAWAVAESAIADDLDDADLFASLHLPVAASLTAVGELSFADYILEGVPDFARKAQHRQLAEILSGRFAGQDRGAFVPAPRSGTEWWRSGPARLPARDTEGRRLVAWMAGRVEAVDSDEVAIHATQVDQDTGPHGAGLIRLLHDDFGQRALDDVEPQNLQVGDFVEIGRYRDAQTEDKTGIVVLAVGPVALPVEILSPERWQVGLGHGSADG